MLVIWYLSPEVRARPVTNTPNFKTAEALLPVVAQDATSGQVLMLAYMNRAAWEQTLASGEAVYFSRSRNRLWKKGEQSGHVQRVKEIYLDCDEDTILLKVEQVGGAACHEGYQSCFFRQWDAGELHVVGTRVFDPKQVYGSSTSSQEKSP
ncbi:MAG: phosphoribosyl-AMP cyclohydrolase [Planctomycetes bacterium]|nr:phosphoribosyl-AMP cyclohydrolase [Planctomycetota bacterium]